MSKQINKPAIVKDAYDDFIFSEIKKAKKLKESIEADELTTSDVFASFYKMVPEVNKEASKLQQDVFSNLLSLEEYKNLVTSTNIDDVASGLATIDFAPKIIEQIKKIEERREEQQQKMGKNAPKDPGLNEIMSKEEIGSMRQDMRQTLKQAQEKTDDWQEMKTAWGIDPGELKKIPFEDKLKLAEQTMKAKSFRNITDLVGRFKNIISGSKTTIFSHGHDEIVDIIQGSSISRVVPSEILKLKMSPKLFYKDMLEGKLLNYNLKQIEEMGKGPILVCLDISASMRGQREEIAKAITMALISIADKDKRAFGLITFDTKVREKHFWSKNNKPTIQERFAIANIISNGGGTNFEDPIVEAIKMRQEEKDLKPSDIIFITDGEYNLSEEFLKNLEVLKTKLDIKIFGIGVCELSEETLNFCDQVSTLTEDNKFEVLKQLITTTSKRISK